MLSFWETVTAKGKGKKNLGPIKAVRFRNILVFKQIPGSLLPKFMETYCYCRTVLTVPFWCNHANCPISSSTLELKLEEKISVFTFWGWGEGIEIGKKASFLFLFFFQIVKKKLQPLHPTSPAQSDAIIVIYNGQSVLWVWWEPFSKQLCFALKYDFCRQNYFQCRKGCLMI